MKKIILLVGFAMMMFFTLCRKERVEANTNSVNSMVLFQYEYLNQAWGYQHTGWLVDSSGNVYCYKLPHSWNFCDSLGLISETAMMNNIQETDSICYHIDKIELKAKIALINKAFEGKITGPIHEMYDAGVAAYYGFVFDPYKRMYKQVVLKQIGDFRIENSTEEARDLYIWLDHIDKKIRKID